MKIYLFAPEQSKEKIQNRLQQIQEILEKAGILVTSSFEEEAAEFSSQDLEKIDESGQTLLDKMNGLVIEASMSSSEIGYLLAYAISQKKPTLYLYEKGTTSKRALKYFSGRNIPNFLLVKSYTPETLEEVVIEYLKLIESGKEGIEIPSIKFTLRITPKIERYLHWKTHNTKLSKADFLRKIIEDIIAKDENYLKYLYKGGRKDD